MKRSEMLDIMLESYCKEVPYNNDGGIQLQWKLVRLLEDMEIAGMCPPLIKIKGTDIYGKPFTNFKNRWDDEEE